MAKGDNNMTDNQFSIPAENGKDITFEDVYNQLYTTLRYFAQQFISSEADAEDIVIGCFAKFWEKGSRIDNLLEIRRFLTTMVKNACIDYIRSKKSKKIRLDNYLIEQQLFSDINIELLELESETLHQVYQEIEKLPTECKKVFKLTYLEGLSRNEVASRLKISPNTVRNQNARAMELLRIVFKDKDLIILLIILASKIFKN